MPKLLSQGKVYVGISAGAIVAGKDISISGWRNGWDANVANLKNLSGLNLVDFAISPHYIESDEKFVKDCAQKTGIEIKTITDQQAISVTNNTIEYINLIQKQV